jgi:hypothetical protein
MKKNHYIHLMVLLLSCYQIGANPTISFFFRADPDMERISRKLSKPGKLAKYTVKGALQPNLIEGIMATYGGYIDASDYNGGVVFPRKHPSDAIDILITPHINPVALFENTIAYWTRVPGLPATVYACEQKYDDTKDHYYWQVQEVPLSEDKSIPLATIVIIANPKNIKMNPGITLTNKTANLVLPDLYVKKGIATIQNAAYTLTIRHLFKPVQTEENREPLKILTHVID